jgi:hypothetical protein
VVFPGGHGVNSPRVKLREQVVCGGPVSDQFPAVQENQLLLRPGQQAPARGQRRDLEARALKGIPDVADCYRGRTRCLRHGEIVAAPAAAFAFLTWTPGYSESMPSAGYTGCGTYFSLGYVRAHNPWVDFSNVLAASNLTFASFPANYSQLPTVSFVIPNLCNDMHYCSRDTGDSWIKQHLGGYASWARSNNSLLIITWDEDGTILGLGGDNNRVPTIFYGAHVRPGVYSEHTSHYGILRTVEDMYGLPHAGASASAAPITDVWN